MKRHLLLHLSALLFTSVLCHAGVDFWEMSKGVLYEQTADNTAPSGSTNWFVYGAVGTDSAADATSAVVEGGNISGALAFEFFAGEWELFKLYPSKAALDAELPAGETYSIILSGGSLGSVTQEFEVVADAYPATPFLTGADYSSLQALEILEPFELNWNTRANPEGSVAFQISEGSVLDGDEVVYLEWDSPKTSLNLSNDWFAADTDYEGLVEFINSTNHSGVGGFGAPGDLYYSALVRFPITPVNTAVAFDDFNDNVVNGSVWTEVFSEPGKAFAETNGRWEFTSGDSPDGDAVAWTFETAALSYTQDWAVAMDLANSLDPSDFSNAEELYFGLVAARDDLNYLFSIEMYVNAFERLIYSGANTNGVEGVGEASVACDAPRISVKLSFDADTKLLTSAYSLGGNYTVLTNFSAAGWGMSDSDTFLTALYCGTDEFAVSASEVYADNFRVYGESAISNHLQTIELEYLRDFASPETADDDFNEWDLILKTDQRVTSAAFTIPTGERLAITNTYDQGASLSWDFERVEDINEPYDADMDGDWLITVGLEDGTFHSTVIPFTKEDGVTPIPVITNQPLFTAVNIAGDLSSVVAEWAVVDPEANIVEIGKDSGDEDLTIGFYSDGFTDDVGAAPPFDGPLSTRISAAAPLDVGDNEFNFANLWARTAYNVDGVPYVVLKGSSSAFDIDTLDLDGDGMDDAWEIEFFGSTNAVKGAALEDFDSDGQINLHEFIADSNPTNSASVFAVEMVERGPEGFILNWTAAEGRYYGVYWAESVTNAFMPLEEYMEFPRNSYTDSYHVVEDSGFYYIDVKRAE